MNRGLNTTPAVHVRQVIEAMSKGVFTPVIYRPLFDHLRMVTCRTFETPAANAIPLFTQTPEYVEAIFGEDALELVLPNERPHKKILEILSAPERYAPIVLASDNGWRCSPFSLPFVLRSYATARSLA